MNIFWISTLMYLFSYIKRSAKPVAFRSTGKCMTKRQWFSNAWNNKIKLKHCTFSAIKLSFALSISPPKQSTQLPTFLKLNNFHLDLLAFFLWDYKMPVTYCKIFSIKRHTMENWLLTHCMVIIALWHWTIFSLWKLWYIGKDYKMPV